MNGRGRIKAGEGTLIGNAGEYYVVAELLKRGVVAALAPRNAPGFDILATRGSKTVRLHVKTKTEAYDIWQWSTKKDRTILRNLNESGDFTVLVNLTARTRDLAFFVVPSAKVDQWLRASFEAWLTTPVRGGRPHSPDNKKRHLSYAAFADLLKQYHDDWGQLWEGA